MPTSEEIVKRRTVDRLFWDARLDVSDLTVEVQDGTVILGGTVSTLSRRRLAERVARRGRDVHAVDNRISIHYPTSDERPGDVDLETSVETALAFHPGLEAGGIEVEVRRGVVTLRGRVPSYPERLAAEETASAIAGVLGVDDRLEVAPARQYADRDIVDHITATIDQELHVDAGALDVEADGGVVTLRGAVRDTLHHAGLRSVVARTRGVKELVDELRVEGPPVEEGAQVPTGGREG